MKMKKIKLITNQHFDQSLPFGMELLHSKFQELLKLEGGSYTETTDTIILETSDGKKITANKNKVREQNNARISYEGELHFGKKCLVTKFLDNNIVELLDYFYPNNSYRIFMEIES